MTIENINKDSYILECIVCGRQEAISLVAHRNKEQAIVGFIAVCPDHVENVTGGSFQLLTVPKPLKD